MKISIFLRRSRDWNNKQGLITVSTVVFVSVFMLAIALSFLFLNRYMKSYYYPDSTLLRDTIISIHEAIVISCCYGYGGSSVAVFVPDGSYMFFQDNCLSIIGIDLEKFNREYLETILKSRMRCSFLDLEVETNRDTLILKYYVLTTSERKQVTFTRLTIPPGSHVIFIYCKAFHQIELTIAPSG